MYYKAKKNKLSVTLAILCCSGVLFLGGCATTGTGAATSSEIDPLEDWNRDIYTFNKMLDDYIADPIVQAYDWITPHFVQTGIGNFFSNLKDINVTLNDFLQAKFLQGGEDTGRFLLNSTVGLGGLFDVASEVGLEKHVEDFDQTFAVWGIPQGPYLVLPVLGPTTGRGISGGILDAAVNPANYVGAPISVLDLLNQRANAEGAIKLVEEAALDPYVFTRDAFLQKRKRLINDGKLDSADDVLNTDESGVDDKTSKTQVDKPNYKVTLGAEKKDFKQAVDGFSSTKKSFDGTNQVFKSASDKLDDEDNLLMQKKNRKKNN